MNFEVSTRWSRSGSVMLLIGFLALVLGMGILIGTLAAPGSWYAALEKPVFNPPNWIFAPVWTVLYVFIATAGWRTFLRAPRSMAMYFWYGQLALNWIWSPVFFVLHLMWAAFLVISAMFVLIVLFIGQSREADRISATLFLPYAAWVGFAGLLNFSLAVLN